MVFRTRILRTATAAVAACTMLVALAACAGQPQATPEPPLPSSSPSETDEGITETAEPPVTEPTGPGLPGTTSPEATEEASEITVEPIPVTEHPLPKIPTGAVLVPRTPEGEPVTGEAPETLLNAIRADLEERTGLEPESFTVVRDEFVTWNDGSLGCPRPGEVYTQALVDGYWVVMRAGDQPYDYRATQEGNFFLCELGGQAPGP